MRSYFTEPPEKPDDGNSLDPVTAIAMMLLAGVVIAALVCGGRIIFLSGNQ